MKKSLTVLLLITLLGGFLRFLWLDRFPVSPNWDEVSHGYNAYSILKTGKDEWGVTFPLIFRAFGDYKLPVYIYLTVLPVWLFGLSVFSIRFISALAGTLAIPGIYLLARELFPQTPSLRAERGNPYKELPLVAAFLLALLPWHFFISRPALEANLSLTLIIFGFYFLIHSINISSSDIPGSNRNPSGISLLISFVLLGLSLHTYNTARVFVPSLLLALVIIYWPTLRGAFATWKSRATKSSRIPSLYLITSFLILAFFAAIVAIQIFTGVGTARYEKLKILSPSIVYQIGESRTLSKLPPLLSKLLYNRPVRFTTTAFQSYFGYFAPQFFYQTSGPQSQFAIPGQNMLTLPLYVLALLGFIVLLINSTVLAIPGLTRNPSNFSRQSFQFLLAWLLLSPVAGSLTADPPQAIRPNPMIPALIILAALGLASILEKTSKKYLTLFAIAIFAWIFVSFGRYFYLYTTQYQDQYSSAWQYGYPQVMAFIREHRSEYDKIFITKRLGEPHIFYAFFTELPPEKLQPGTDNIRFGKSDWYWTDKIDNVYFINDWQIPITSIKTLPLESGGVVSTERSLLITSPDHLPINAHVIETINYLNGQPAFIITSVP